MAALITPSAEPAGVEAGAEAPDQAPVAVGLAWLALAILLLLGLVAFLDRQIVSLMVGMIKADLRITDSDIGLLQGAAFSLVYPVFALPFGYAADRYSRRWVIFLGVLFWSVAATASGLAHSFSTLLAARVGVGIGEAALGPAAVSLLSQMFPKHRLGLIFAIYSSGSIFGGAAALAIGGAVITLAGAGLDLPLVGHLAPWQVAFVATGVPGAAAAFLAFLIREPKRHHPPPPAAAAAARFGGWGEVLAFCRDNWRFMSCYLVGFTSFYLITWATLAWTPAILERSYHWTVGQVGAVLGVFTVAMGLPGQLFNGVTVDRLFAKGRHDAHMRYYASTALIITVVGIAACFAPSAWFYLALMAPSKWLLNFSGVMMANIQIVTPMHLRGRMAAIIGIVTQVIGGTFGPQAVAFCTDYVFRDDSKVIWSLGLTVAIFSAVAWLAFCLGMKPMREAVLSGSGDA